MCLQNMDGPQVEISGVATLCFDEEGTWFQGSIASEDDTQYAIYGTKSKRLGQNSTGEGGVVDMWGGLVDMWGGLVEADF